MGEILGQRLGQGCGAVVSPGMSQWLAESGSSEREHDQETPGFEL